MFQSLLGFLIRCDTHELISIGRRTAVSIPIGFSNTLRPRITSDTVSDFGVSIPIGFSNTLRQVLELPGVIP